MTKLSYLKILIILILFIFLLPFISSCDPTIIEIFTELNTDYSGMRTIDIAVKTEYLQNSEALLEQNQSLYEKILENLQDGEQDVFEEGEYTHFTSTIDFDDINFLQHISIDNLSETPPERFLARFKKDDYFFYSEYFFEDYIDMKIDDTLLSSSDKNSDYRRIADLTSADSEILSITYQIKFPVKITSDNADVIGDNNIAIWNIKYGDERKINIQGRKTKFLTYFLIVILGIIVLFIIFIIFIIIFSSRRSKRQTPRRKSYYSYDNYFKKDRYFNSGDD
ncbi:MAG: hypothetical protein U9O59_04850 [Actinomycetota bacterium]|nr:hypothetical protein [Actinomycetota bacterium]